MLGLPKATEIVRPLPKRAVFDKFKPTAVQRKLFDEQVSRMSIVAEISPQTVAVAECEDVSAIYIVHVTMKTTWCDKKNIILLSKLIDQRMLFVLQYGDNAQIAAYRAGKVLISESKPLSEWKLTLSGLDLGTIWVNAIAQIGGIDISDGKDLDASIIENERREKLMKQIATLEKKAMNEKQPRRKWDLAEEVMRLKMELEE
jgi:hypothetical protein